MSASIIFKHFYDLSVDEAKLEALQEILCSCSNKLAMNLRCTTSDTTVLFPVVDLGMRDIQCTTVCAKLASFVLMAINEGQSARVHRSRFIDWTPSPITSITFPPAPIDPSKKLSSGFPVLAVGRANGNIELYEWCSNPPPHQTYHGYVLRRVCFEPSLSTFPI